MSEKKLKVSAKKLLEENDFQYNKVTDEKYERTYGIMFDSIRRLVEPKYGKLNLTIDESDETRYQVKFQWKMDNNSCEYEMYLKNETYEVDEIELEVSIKSLDESVQKNIDNMIALYKDSSMREAIINIFKKNMG